MSSLLCIASRIQAAIQAYTSVIDHTDLEKWKAQFQNEKAKSIEEFMNARKNNLNMPAPDLHPLIVALALVLDEKDPNRFQFSLITENYPQDELHRNKYYNPLAVFPDLSSYLLPREDWWWEELTAESCSGQTPQEPIIPEEDTMQEEPAAFDRQVAPESAASLVPELPAATQPKVPASAPVSYFGVLKLLATSAEPAPAVPTLLLKLRISPLKSISSAPREDVEMAADKPSKRHCKRKAAETAAPPKSSKRPMPALQAQSQTSESSEVDELAWEPLFDVTFECDRCLAKGIQCKPLPTSSCQQCHDLKLGCSLMPQNNLTGKPNRQPLMAKYVFEYRLQQQQQVQTLLGSVGRKGKRTVCATEEDSQPAATGSGVSPSTALALDQMTLESESSKANSSAPSPASRMGSSALFSVEPSPSAPSVSSDDGQNLRARVAELEATEEDLKRDVAALKKATSHK
ncbi:hypothetical protein EI94DRAFT_1800973 [Lactarius quietus]|nr:hypothetical protein EI94DRAFT_1800973 [Lactarius quietus]